MRQAADLFRPVFEASAGVDGWASLEVSPRLARDTAGTAAAATAWPLFILTSLVLILTPGQDMILVMSRSIAQGAAAGVATAAGVSVGLVGHTLLATLGLGAVLRTSE